MNQVRKGEKGYTQDDLEMVLDKLPYMAWLKDVEDKYIYVNEAYAKVVGSTKKEMIGKHIEEYWPSAARTNSMSHDAYVQGKGIPQMFDDEVDFGEAGGIRNFEIYKEAIYDKDGVFQMMLGAGRENTLSRVLNQAIESNHDTLLTGGNSVLEKQERYSNLANLVEKDIKNWLGANGVSVWLFQCERLIPYMSIGEEHSLAFNQALEKIEKRHLQHQTPGLEEGIQSVAARRDFFSTTVTKGIEDIGLYTITYRGELQGVLVTTFGQRQVGRMQKDVTVKKICLKIGNILHMHFVADQLHSTIGSYKDTQEELTLFLETVVDLIAIIGEDGYFKKVTPAWVELLGWSMEELLSMHWSDIIHPEDFIHTMLLINSDKRPEVIRDCVNRYRCKNGEYKWLQWNNRMLQKKGIQLVAVKDITEEMEVKKKNELLERVIKLESVKNEFFANISHEFRTPINIILSSVEMMELNRKELEEKGISSKYLGYMRQNAYRLLRLVNNLIDISKIDAGQYRLNVEKCNIVNVVEEVVLSVASYIEGKGIQLIFDTEIEEEIIACDPDKIEQMILNLLSNAVKFTAQGGIIRIDMRKYEQQIEISIADDGIGIEEDKLPLIFERFVQVDSVVARNVTGSGIGLSLVKSLVALHEGNISVTSELGKGTTFTIQLPIEQLAIEGEKEVYPYSCRVERLDIEFADVYYR